MCVSSRDRKEKDTGREAVGGAVERNPDTPSEEWEYNRD